MQRLEGQVVKKVNDLKDEMYPIKPMTEQLVFVFNNLLFITLVMLAVLRFKRVEL